MTVERRLAAILAADVAGYSRLMSADEEGTLARLTAHRRELLDPSIARHRGRIVKTTGDGLLVEFTSVVDAVRCAAEVQAGMAERNDATVADPRLEFRIGINVGDIVEQDDDIFGDGVNIAARLEAIAEPGGICVSARVQEDAAGKVDVAFDDLGEQTLKNIARPVRAYRLRLQSSIDNAALKRPPLSLPDKPSIAVLPFQNMSGDPEQEYFADGVVEEIITALSRFHGLFVIARNSSFTYKGRAIDVKQVGRELGVRYVLEGSVRKATNRVRISGQLIDSATGAHLWADRFEGGLEAIFDLQDQVTSSVVSAIAPKLEQIEIERAKRKPTSSLDAYDYFLHGLSGVHQWTRDGNKVALANFYRAIELDPGFASAYGLAARCYAQRKSGSWGQPSGDDIDEAARLSRRAVQLGRDDAVALCTAGFALADVVGEYEHGDALIERAQQLNPNLAWAWYFSSWVKVWLGAPAMAIEHANRAIRLSPNDPQMFMMQAAIAYAHFTAARYDEAYSWAEIALREKPDAFHPTCVAAASRALAGKVPEARRIMVRVQELDPGLHVSNLKEHFSAGRPEDFAIWAEGLRRAGLQE